jgi:hypothetical protein
MRRLITDEEATAAIIAAPAPQPHVWMKDAAASGDRMRLFLNDTRQGQVGVAYADGRWFVDDPTGERYQPVAKGIHANLVGAMRQVIEQARTNGWEL